MTETQGRFSFDEDKAGHHQQQHVEDSGEKYISEVAEETVSLEEFSYSHQEVKRLLRKLDFRLLPILSILYLFSFLDRTNIGNARLDNLEADLGLKGVEYNNALSFFFYTYILFEVPSNIILKRWRPSAWIACIMFAWGMTMTFSGFMKNYAGLVVVRFMLGATEAGLFPGVTYYITMWYCRNECAFRIALFFSSATISGAFGGLLATAIIKMGGVGGYPGWAWIFFIEGAATVLLSGVGYYFIVDSPKEAKFLTEREKLILIDRLKKDSSSFPNEYRRSFVWAAFKDIKVWMHAFAYLGMLLPLYSFSIFLPTIVKGMGFTNTRSQLMSVPPYVFGCISCVAFAYFSDRTNRRGYFIAGLTIWTIVGYLLLMNCKAMPGRYVGACMGAIGIFPQMPLSLAWNGSNLGGHTKRGVGMALHISLGSFGGAIGMYIYRTQDVPYYRLGHGIAIAGQCLTFILALSLIFLCKHLNKKRDILYPLDSEEKPSDEWLEEERNKCDGALFFRYRY